MTTANGGLTAFVHSLFDEIQSINVDQKILYYFKMGLGCGILLITFFSFFPGEPFGIPYGTRGSGGGTEQQETSSSPETQQDVGSTKKETNKKSEWAGDDIPKEALEKVRKKYNLSEEQMRKVMHKSRQDIILGGEDGQSFHRQLNRGVYVIIISVLIYVVNRDYKDFFSFWFSYYFPKESKTLGMSGLVGE